jgi:hypothetical protein
VLIRTEGRVRRLHGALGSFRQERGRHLSWRGDDGLGCAALIEMGRAFTKLPAPPRRSILFLAVTAEEQGLLGSQYYSVSPIYRWQNGRRHQHGQLEHARADQGLTLTASARRTSTTTRATPRRARAASCTPTPSPEEGVLLRSDISTSRGRGAGAESRQRRRYIGKPADIRQAGADDGTPTATHPARRRDADWDLSGTREDLTGLLRASATRGAGDKFPEGNPATSSRQARRDVKGSRKPRTQ